MNRRDTCLAATFLAAFAVPLSAATCESLSSLSLPGTTIIMAQKVGAGEFNPPAGRGGGRGPNYKELPAFCRVQASVKPMADSDIRIEVWMPVENWNGRFEGTGNGGWAGSIGLGPLATALERGYAVAATDTGHTGGSAAFAIDHPEQLIDFEWRSIHEMTVKGKAITSAFYGGSSSGGGPDLKYSYFSGCSTGGRQALKEAQRFPADYDGIIVGDPGAYSTVQVIRQVAVWQEAHKTEGSLIPAEKLTVLHRAVLDQCDALDGVKDGVLENPRLCKFDPTIIECKGADAPSCLTAAQVETARAIYTSPKNARTGEEIFFGYEPGSELGWESGEKQPLGFAVDVLRFALFKDPKWDPATANYDTDVATALKVGGELFDARDPDIRTFLARGGKLLMYHGWTDPGIPPSVSLTYYQSVLSKLGNIRNLNDDVRLFMVPGMNHCGGGDGPDEFDMLSAIDEWRGKSKAPVRIVAEHRTNNVVDRSRPLCPYPQAAVYKGTGSTNEAQNFSCASQKNTPK
jgi:feruloyl esterase